MPGNPSGSFKKSELLFHTGNASTDTTLKLSYDANQVFTFEKKGYEENSYTKANIAVENLTCNGTLTVSGTTTTINSTVTTYKDPVIDISVPDTGYNSEDVGIRGNSN